MKNKGLIITLIIILSIGVVLVSLTLGFLLFNKGHGFTFNSSVSNKLTKDEVIDNFKDVYIDTNAADIVVKNGSENRLVVYGESDNLEVNSSGNLNISYDSQPCHFFCINVKQAKIELYLTDDFVNNISINNKYGDISVGDFPKSEVSIKSSYGDTSLRKSLSVEVESNAGDVSIGEVSNAVIDNDYGDIKITSIDGYGDINADCGDIEIKRFNVLKDSKIDNSFGNIEIDSINDVRVDAHTSLGDNNVRTNNYKSDIVLTINNSCGDIEVK